MLLFQKVLWEIAPIRKIQWGWNPKDNREGCILTGAASTHLPRRPSWYFIVSHIMCMKFIFTGKCTSFKIHTQNSISLPKIPLTCVGPALKVSSALQNPLLGQLSPQPPLKLSTELVRVVHSCKIHLVLMI